MPMLLGYRRDARRMLALALAAVVIAAVVGLLVWRAGDSGGDRVRGQSARPDPEATETTRDR